MPSRRRKLELVNQDPLAEEPLSTDDIRTDAPLANAKSVVFDEPFALELGGELPEVRCCYETWGTLDADASNAVLVCHAISGDSHAARHDENDQPGWWDGLIGPGLPIDTDQFLVVCPNVLGGCRGTTGPGDFPVNSDGSSAESRRHRVWIGPRMSHRN